VRGALRDSLRSWRRSPGVALVAALSLALGIGATTAAFSVVQQLLLRTLAVPEPHQLFQLASGDGPGFSFAAWERIRERRDLFDEAFAWTVRQVNVAPSGETDLVLAAYASASTFDALRVSPFVGRLFGSADDVRTGGPDGPAVVLTHQFWQRRFAGAPDAVGQSLTIERATFVIIGVLPPTLPGLEAGRDVDLVVPLAASTAIDAQFNLLDSSSRQSLRVILRLDPQRPVGEVVAALRAAQPAIRAATIPRRGPPEILERILREPFVLHPAPHGGGRRDYYVVPAAIGLGLAALVLLAACGNVAMVLLAHGEQRRQELSVRAALGAPAWDGVRQRFVDSAVVAGAGGAIGLALAYAGSSWLTTQLDGLGWQLGDISADWRTAAIGVAAGAITAFVCGVVPALNAHRVSPAETLKSGAPQYTTGDRSQRLVVGAQIAVSLVVVATGMLLFRAYQTVATVAADLRPERTMIADLRFWRSNLPESARELVLAEVLAALAAQPGTQVAAGNNVPLIGGGYLFPFDVPGGVTASNVLVNSVSADYLAATGASIVAGRAFTAEDVAGAPMVGIVNRQFARRFLGGDTRVPQLVWRATSDTVKQPIEIVGVIEDQPADSLMETPEPWVLLLRAQDRPENFNTLVLIRSAGAPSASAVAATIAKASPELSFTLHPYEEFVWMEFERERILARMATVFVGLAMLLAATGVFGVQSYAVTTRRRELGIRIALGATTAQIRRLVVGRSGSLAAIGGAVGLAASLAAGRALSTRLHGVAPPDAAVCAVAAAVMAGVVAIATWLPARRAARVDPIVVLRDE